MSPSSQHWKKGVAVTSLKALNASVNNSLPKSTEMICQSLATFTRFLLGYNHLTKTYPLGPTPDERCQLRPISQKEIMGDRQVFSTTSTSLNVEGDENTLHIYKALCLADLKKHGITRLSFDWQMPDKDPWNRTMVVFIVKHWQYANSQGAFNKQSLTPGQNTEETCISIVLRWMRGRSEEIRQNRRSPQKVLQKEMRRKKRILFQYRVKSLSRLLVANNLPEKVSDVLPNHDCCSDTEWEPEMTRHPSVGLVWRSQQFTSVIHQLDRLSWTYASSAQGSRLASQRFDQCRTAPNQTNSHAAVCPGLPENFYDPIFLSKLTLEEKVALQMKPVSNVLNTLPAIIQKYII